MRAESGRELEKIAGDRGSLESQLAELESIRKLSEMTSGSEVPAAPAEATPAPTPTASTPTASAPVPAASAPTPVESAPPSPPPPAAVQSSPAREPESNKESESTEDRPRFSDVGWPARDIVDIPATPASAASPVSAASAPTPTPSQSRRATPSSSQPAVEAKAAEPAPRASMDAAAAAPRPSASPAASASRSYAAAKATHSGGEGWTDLVRLHKAGSDSARGTARGQQDAQVSGVWYAELSHGVVLRALRRRARDDVEGPSQPTKKAPPRGAFFFLEKLWSSTSSPSLPSGSCGERRRWRG